MESNNTQSPLFHICYAHLYNRGQYTKKEQRFKHPFTAHFEYVGIGNRTLKLCIIEDNSGILVSYESDEKNSILCGSLNEFRDIFSNFSELLEPSTLSNDCHEQTLNQKLE